MPVCNKHHQSYSNGSKCPDCNGKYRGMQTPLTRVGTIHNPRVNGKPWKNPLNAPAKSTHIKQS